MNSKVITYEQYAAAMEEKKRIEKHLEHLTTITRAYIYQEERERIAYRKQQETMEEFLLRKGITKTA